MTQQRKVAPGVLQLSKALQPGEYTKNLTTTLSGCEDGYGAVSAFPGFCPSFGGIRRTRTVKSIKAGEEFLHRGELHFPNGWYASAALTGKLDTTASRAGAQVGTWRRRDRAAIDGN